MKKDYIIYGGIMTDINSICRINSSLLYKELIEQFGHADNYKNTIITHVSDNNIPYMTFRPYTDNPVVKQIFSTRLGGVSTGMYESMNLTFNPVGEYAADSYDNVYKNFERMASVLDIPLNRMVYTKQTHTTNVKIVDGQHAGMGIIKPRDYDNIDGLVTNTRNLCLVSSYADCIPVTLVDESKHVIAAMHAGWKGTVGNIAANGYNAMITSFGSKAEDITAFIGPGICMDCYEVSSDVADMFKKVYTQEEIRFILKNGKTKEKYQLNLISANYINLINCGIAASNIYVSDICTCCNSSILFSHRASHGKRGILCNFIYLK